MRIQDEKLARWSGRILMLGSAVSFSTIGIFTEIVKLPLSDILFVRGIFGAAAIWVIARLLTKERITDRKSYTWPSLLVATLFTVGMVSLVAGYRIGAVANVAVVYATTPIIVAIFVKVFLREEQPTSLWYSGIGVAIGVAIMMWRDKNSSNYIAMLLAFLMSICVAGVIVVARNYKATPMLVASMIACVLSSVIAFPFMASIPNDLSSIATCALFGTVTLGLGRVFLIIGARRIPPGEAALIDVLDAPMTPVWSWLILGMRPTDQAIAGGSIVVICVMLGVAFAQGARALSDGDLANGD